MKDQDQGLVARLEDTVRTEGKHYGFQLSHCYKILVFNMFVSGFFSDSKLLYNSAANDCSMCENMKKKKKEEKLECSTLYSLK